MMCVICMYGFVRRSQATYRDITHIIQGLIQDFCIGYSFDMRSTVGRQSTLEI